MVLSFFGAKILLFVENLLSVNNWAFVDLIISFCSYIPVLKNKIRTSDLWYISMKNIKFHGSIDEKID